MLTENFCSISPHQPTIHGVGEGWGLLLIDLACSAAASKAHVQLSPQALMELQGCMGQHAH